MHKGRRKGGLLVSNRDAREIPSWICSNVTFYSATSRLITIQSASFWRQLPRLALHSFRGFVLDGIRLHESTPTMHPESASSVLRQIAAQNHFSAISKPDSHFGCRASYPCRAVLGRHCFGDVELAGRAMSYPWSTVLMSRHEYLRNEASPETAPSPRCPE
jgi:hypothetical protein